MFLGIQAYCSYGLDDPSYQCVELLTSIDKQETKLEALLECISINIIPLFSFLCLQSEHLVFVLRREK
jgi:hypothetical protein